MCRGGDIFPLVGPSVGQGSRELASNTVFECEQSSKRQAFSPSNIQQLKSPTPTSSKLFPKITTLCPCKKCSQFYDTLACFCSVIFFCCDPRWSNDEEESHESATISHIMVRGGTDCDSTQKNRILPRTTSRLVCVSNRGSPCTSWDTRNVWTTPANRIPTTTT